MRWHDGMDSGNGWLVMVIATIMLLIVLGVVAWIARGNDNDRPPAIAAGGQTTPLSTPRQILDDRFARGEIDADEYRSRREALASP